MVGTNQTPFPFRTLRRYRRRRGGAVKLAKALRAALHRINVTHN